MELGAEERMVLGKSILVPSVQELAKECSVEVPERYLRPENDHDRPLLQADQLDVDHDDLQVPIINMEGLISGDEIELLRLHSASKDWGFFQLINHGVSSSLVEKFKLETIEFFNLPLEEKKKYWQTPTNVEGFGQVFVVSEEQKLDWADMFFLITLPKHQRRPNLLPMLPLPYRETLECYSAELKNLALKILGYMAKALNIDIEEMRGMFEEGGQSIRMNYYPPCPQPDKVIGLTPHSDAVGLTILLQLNEIEGLQIKKDCKWVPIKPLPGAFIVNIGDILEILSNGIYPSILHRATVNGIKERLSVATFYGPAFDQEIRPLPNLITPDTPPKFRRISVLDYFNGLFARELDGKSYLDLMRITHNDDCQEPNSH